MSEKDLTAQSVVAFIEATASKSTTPGGGSVAGVVGALGVALGEMSVAFTHGKKAFADHDADYERIAGRLAKVRAMFMRLIEEDMAAFDLYSKAVAADGPDKDAAMQAALTACIDVPREMAKLALSALGDLDSLTGRCNKWLLSDLAAAAVLAEAAVKLCDYNVRINAPACDDRAAAAEVLAQSQRDCLAAGERVGRIEAAVKDQL